MAASATAPPILLYQRRLGIGSYKSVYLVSVLEQEAGNDSVTLAALAVERLLTKREAKDEIRSLQLLEELHKTLPAKESSFLERIDAWWLQSCPPSDFAPNKVVCRDDNRACSPLSKVPGSFLSSLWLLALKPVYDMDLRKFMEQAPLGSGRANGPGGLRLNDQGALQLARDCCHIGSLLRASGIVHRDIKPKNIMLSKGRAILIDFGFAKRVVVENGSSGPASRLCVEEPGRVVGEVKYVWPDDVAFYKGCHRGDAYAMGKTLFEVFFEEAPSFEKGLSDKETISQERAQEERRAYLRRWTHVRKSSIGDKRQSRFELSSDLKSLLLSVIGDLCGFLEGNENNNYLVSFRVAEDELQRYGTPTQGGRELLTNLPKHRGRT